MKKYALSLALFSLAGCSTGPVGPDAPPIARVWESKCGACHVPVEPGTRTHKQLGEAFFRHKTRLALTDDEWNEMVEFLASDKKQVSAN